jgi:hypothetical protein
MTNTISPERKAPVPQGPDPKTADNALKQFEAAQNNAVANTMKAQSNIGNKAANALLKANIAEQVETMQQQVADERAEVGEALRFAKPYFENVKAKNLTVAGEISNLSDTEEVVTVRKKK